MWLQTREQAKCLSHIGLPGDVLYIGGMAAASLSSTPINGEFGNAPANRIEAPLAKDKFES